MAMCLSTAMRTKMPDPMPTKQCMTYICTKHSGRWMVFALNHKMIKILGMMLVARPMSTTARMPKKWYICWCSVVS